MKAYFYRPAGNDTALVPADLPSCEKQKIAKILLEKYTQIEQVGFIYERNGKAFLDMAGGEMCLNALRAASAYFLANSTHKSLNHCQKSFEFHEKNGEIFNLVDIDYQLLPTPPLELLSDFLGQKITNASLIDLQGIVHLVCECERICDAKNFKAYARELFAKLALDRHLACGLMLLCGEFLHPFVYVKNIGSLYYESACGSGSMASFIHKNCAKISLLQPSGGVIKIQKLAQNYQISSPVNLLKIIEF